MKDISNTYLGQYYITEVVGRGSTSTVYKAFQSSLNRYVAVKVLANNVDPQFAVRFKREAYAVAQLQHPNILPIYDYGEQDGLRYFVMQYVEGSTTLDQLLGGRPMEPIAALRLILPLLSALSYAHAQGVVHRDIKPANIMLPRPDWPMLADFGIAKLIDDSQQLTPPGQSLGTAIYMAPERATSRAVDLRTDLYSIGVVLYEMLTGRVPFDGVGPVDVLRKHLNTPPPPPRSLNPDLPAALEPVLLRSLEKNPSDRYQTADEMSQAIERAISQIERQNAQRQLQQMLQRRVAETRVATPVVPPNPYQTRLLPEFDTLGTPARTRVSPVVGWLRWGVPVLLLLVLGVIMIAREARGGTGEAAPSAPSLAGAATPTTAAITEAMPTSIASVAPPEQSPAPASRPTTAAIAEVAPTSDASAAPSEPSPAPASQPITRPQPTAAPAAPPPPPIQSTPQIARQDQTTIIRFEDSDWQGGYRRAAGRTYGGRTATWIYGTSTEWSSMQAGFDLAAQPAGIATLTIEGMDSEDRLKTPISILVNGVEIFNGPNPLPNDDQPLESGTWASFVWSFDAQLLHPGHNDIQIKNLASGAFSLPPFFMLDYADLAYTSS
jgi:serine/threonine-protein kinase